MVFTFIVLTVVMSFTRWTFTEPRIAAMGLWFLAFLTAETLRSQEVVAGETSVAEGSPPEGAAGTSRVAALGKEPVSMGEGGPR